MKVKELIEKLQKYDPNITVRTYDGKYGEVSHEEISLELDTEAFEAEDFKEYRILVIY